jgi:hypothetical protein
MYIWIRLPWWTDNIKNTGDEKKDKANESIHDIASSVVRIGLSPAIFIIGLIIIIISPYKKKIEYNDGDYDY